MNSFVKQDDTRFTLDDAIFRVNAANNYYLAFASDKMVDPVFDLAKRMNINVLRTWAFSDCGAPPASGTYFHYWNADTNQPDYNDGPTGLALLDRTIASAENNNMRLILPFANYWSAYGGAPQYLKWFGLTALDQFFLHPNVKQAYRNYVEHLLTRKNTVTGRFYHEEPAIMAWELCNEPRCPIPGGVDILCGWVAEMTAWVKSLDPNHLVGVGDEGFLHHNGAPDYAAYNGSYGVDCERLLGIPAVDFGTCHLYPNFAHKEDPAAFGQRWIREHIESAQRANKPMLIEEYGWESTRTSARRDDVFDRWLNQVKASEGSGAGLWMIACNDDSGQPYKDYDHFTVYSPDEVPSVVAFNC